MPIKKARKGQRVLDLMIATALHRIQQWRFVKSKPRMDLRGKIRKGMEHREYNIDKG
jgi:hypothetical protein